MSLMEAASVYIPMDRRQALARGQDLPERVTGAALFADISGFTPLTEALAAELGPQRGAEELARHLNHVYDALIGEIYHYGGAVIGFAGDAITCWLDGDDGVRATACALAMQQAMGQFAAVRTASGRQVTLAVKVAVAAGPARRFMVGDPEIQVIDVLSGSTLDRLAATEHLCEKGEVLLDARAVASAGERVRFARMQRDDATGQTCGVACGLAGEAAPQPWPEIPPGAIGEEACRPWLAPPVYRRLTAGLGEFLAELRPAVALFMRFGGIDYDADPAAGAKLDRYVRQVQRILACYEGTLIQLTVGDKGSYLYAAFGAPVAHEDDAVRATAAASELRSMSACSELACQPQIGIAQGRMRTGAYGGSSSRTYGVLGDAVNLAARLMTAAGEGQVLAARAICQATADVFAWESLPDLRVKGKADPVAVGVLVGRNEAQAIRLQEPAYALPMVGRQTELALIEGKLDQALAGQGQIAGITGEAGMGKSRLVAEVIRLANNRQVAGYGGECQAYGANTSYLVWQNIWRGLFGLQPGACDEEQMQRLASALAAIDPALLPRLPLLGAVLNLRIPDTDLTRAFDAKLRKSSLEALLADCLRARARERPLLIVLEDCHWLDPLSHDLLMALGRALAGLPVLLLLAYRPPDPASGSPLRVCELPYFMEICLAEFTAAEAERLIRLKLAQTFGAPGELPAALVERVTARAQGNPFYIEELLNYVRDRGIDPADTRAVAELDLPATLHSLVLSRIDRLAEGPRATLHVASVVGRVFRAAVLWNVERGLGGPEQVLACLDVLRTLDLTPIDSEPEQTYLFKHVITQEAAYESLPFARRAVLHDAIACHLERAAGADVGQCLDLLAYHFDRSENLPKRREYLLRAGEAAQARYANDAAQDYFRRLLPLLEERAQGKVLASLGKVHEMMGQYGRATDCYEQALALAERFGDESARTWCQLWLSDVLRKQGRLPEAAARQERALAGFEVLQDEDGIAWALVINGILDFMRGDCEGAQRSFARGLEIRRRQDAKPRAAALLANLGAVARSQSDFALARRCYTEAIEIYRTAGDRRGTAYMGLYNLSNVALDVGDVREARALLEEAAAILRTIGDQYALSFVLNNLGSVAREEDNYALARASHAEALRTMRELGDPWWQAYFLDDVGRLCWKTGEPAAALHLVAAASAFREKISSPRTPQESEQLEAWLCQARQGLTEAARAEAWASGHAMALDDAVAEALAELGAIAGCR